MTKSFNDLPAFTRFHIMIGIFAISFAVIALALRIVLFFKPKISRGINDFHVVFGWLYIIFAVFMPITSNFIWPRKGTPRSVVFFILSMFISMFLAIFSIKLYLYLNSMEIAKESVQLLLDKAFVTSTVGEIDLDIEYHSEDNTETEMKECDKLSEPIVKLKIVNRTYIFLKYLHGILMFYSLLMILGAAGAFISRASSPSWPYQQGKDTDQLYGRCYGRNLNTTEIPEWLSNLPCGQGPWCSVSSRNSGDENPFYNHALD